MKRNQEFGVDFNIARAESLGLDPYTVYQSILDDLQPVFVRISAQWDRVEPLEGSFMFKDVDWQIQEAYKRGIQIILVLGQKTPRWPECHIPSWNNFTGSEFRKYLFRYIETVVERYKKHPALKIWQVENEPFFNFGECKNFHREFVASEVNLVRKLDNHHKILLTDSGEHGTWKQAAALGDVLGINIYRAVQDNEGKTKQYWFPVFFYNLKAKFFRIPLNKMMISELQCEPWISEGNPKDATVETMEQTLNAEKLSKHFDFASRVGVRQVCLWGSEWWYFMSHSRGDERYWNMVKEKLQRT